MTVLAAAAFTIPLGALAEELICRAWLPQLLGRWVTSPVLAYGLVVPVFAFVHNPGSIVEWANHLISGTCFAILA
ncbi:type II CAAX prenyl endopeptidase Rce1 family protein [Luteococcus sp.]|uniref:CPBP family glutamic-type intramembrane protease n=1 Tax=Luteococcus sp. TaxID=1969402 RepID=UPI00373503A7